MHPITHGRALSLAPNTLLQPWSLDHKVTDTNHVNVCEVHYLPR